MKLYINFWKENNWELYRPNRIFENTDYIYLLNKKGNVYRSFAKNDIYQKDIKP